MQAPVFRTVCEHGGGHVNFGINRAGVGTKVV